MKIICHRGFWKKKEEQNGLLALRKSFIFDGVEVDLRSKNSQIILSHDPVLNKKYLSLDQAFKMSPPDFFWALNIKEDGLGTDIKKLLLRHNIKKYMCFDLSYPEYVIYKDLNLKVYLRLGDQECYVKERNEVVFDCFETRKFKTAYDSLAFKNDPKVFIISPELHKQNHSSSWNFLMTKKHKNMMICTDYPDKAETFFNQPHSRMVNSPAC